MTALREGVRGLTEVPLDDAWQLPQFERELARAVDSAGGDGAVRAAAGRRPRAARLAARAAGRPAPTSAPARLTVCTHGADALGAPPGGLPGRPRRRRLPARPARSTATTCWPAARSPASATSAARTASSCSTRSWRPARRSSSPTPAPTSTPAPPGRPPCRWASCSTPLDRTAAAPVRDAGAASATRCSRTTPATSRPGGLVGDDPFSFDGPRWRRPRGGRGSAHLAAAVPRPARCRAAPREDVSLADLKTFLAHPVRDVPAAAGSTSRPRSRPRRSATRSRSTSTRSRLWEVGDRLLREVLAGAGPGRGDDRRAAARHPAARRAGHARPRGRSSRSPSSSSPAPPSCATGDAARVDVDVDLGGGRRLTGTVSGVYGSRVVSLGYSRLKARAAAARPGSTCSPSAPADPDESWTAPRRRPGPRRPARVRSPARSTTGRVDWLRDLVDAARPRAAPAAAGAGGDRARLGRGARPRADAATTARPTQAAGRSG